MITQLFIATRTIFANSAQNFFTILKQAPAPFIFTYVFCDSFQHYFLEVSRLSSDNQNLQLLARLGGLSTDLLEFMILTILVTHRVNRLENSSSTESLITFLNRHAKDLVLESLRAFAYTVLWLLLFIIPGIFKSVRYYFVPYVVLADPLYAKGERDALEHSNSLVRGITLPLFILLVGTLFLDLARSTMREETTIFEKPVAAISIGVLFYLVDVFMNVFIFRIYLHRAKNN